MAKALTREDLLYILQSIFRLSEQENNAFQMLNDGLYVEDYHVDLQAHVDDENVHVDADIKNILTGFSISEAGLLLHNGTPVTMAVSKKEGNSISVEIDGLYVPDVAQAAADHIVNEDIHVTATDKENWNNTLQQAKNFTIDELSKLVIYNIEIVTELPKPIEIPADSEDSTEDVENPESTTIYPSSTTLYLLANDPECPEECTYTMYMYLQDAWRKLTITNETLKKFALKTEVEDAIKNSHTHENKEVVDSFTETEEGDLLYKGEHIREMGISDKADNAAQLIDGKLYVRDFDKEIKSMQAGIAGFEKYNLYSDEISDSGVYELKDYIDNYSMILVEYYYRPNDENEQPGCAKTAVIDTDILNHLYTKNMDYMLEYGYGILMSNSKIRMHGDKLWVDYYHNVCIYRITGIGRKGEDSNE